MKNYRSASSTRPESAGKRETANDRDKKFGYSNKPRTGEENENKRANSP